MTSIWRTWRNTNQNFQNFLIKSRVVIDGITEYSIIPKKHTHTAPKESGRNLWYEM